MSLSTSTLKLEINGNQFTSQIQYISAICACLYIYIYICVYIYIYMCVCVCVCVCLYFSQLIELTIVEEYYQYIRDIYFSLRVFLVALIKNPSAIQGRSVLSLGWEDPLKKEMANHSPGGSVVKNLSAVGRHKFDPWIRKIPCRRE